MLLATAPSLRHPRLPTPQWCLPRYTMGALMDRLSRCALLMVFASSCSYASSTNDLQHPCLTFTDNAPIMRRLSLFFAVSPGVSVMPPAIDQSADRAASLRGSDQSHQIRALLPLRVIRSVRRIVSCRTGFRYERYIHGVGTARKVEGGDVWWSTY